MSCVRISPIFAPQRWSVMMKGDRLMFSAPPARPKPASPSISDCTTEMIACTPDPQSRLTFIAGTLLGMPACIAATRLRYISLGSVLMTWPKATWPICAAATPDLSSAALATTVPRSIGVVPASAPPNVPMAVRAPPRMTMSVMDAYPLCGASLAQQRARKSQNVAARQICRRRAFPLLCCVLIQTHDPVDR